MAEVAGMTTITDVKYDIVKAGNLEKLISLVNERLSSGYEISGSPFEYTEWQGAMGTVFLAQAIVKKMYTVFQD